MKFGRTKTDSTPLKGISLFMLLCFCFSTLAWSQAKGPDADDVDELAPVSKAHELAKEINDVAEKIEEIKNSEEAASTAESDEKTEPENPTEVWESYIGNAEAAIGGLDITDTLSVEDIVEPIGLYHYAAFGKPDPFIPPVENKEVAKISGVEIPIISPIQKPLKLLRVAGMWELDDGTRKALVLTDKGEGVVASVGDPIGLSGKIIEIANAGVITRQYRIRSDGSREFQDHVLEFGEMTEDDSIGGSVILEPGKEPVLKADPDQAALESGTSSPQKQPQFQNQNMNPNQNRNQNPNQYNNRNQGQMQQGQRQMTGQR